MGSMRRTTSDALLADNSMYAEQRRSTRIPIQIDCGVKLVADDGRAWSGDLLDFSFAGLAVWTTEAVRLSPGDPVQAQVASRVLPAVITYVTECLDGYRVGVQWRVSRSREVEDLVRELLAIAESAGGSQTSCHGPDDKPAEAAR